MSENTDIPNERLLNFEKNGVIWRDKLALLDGENKLRTQSDGRLVVQCAWCGSQLVKVRFFEPRLLGANRITDDPGRNGVFLCERCGKSTLGRGE